MTNRHSRRIRRIRSGLLIGGALAALAALFLSDPIPQDPAYHDFADTRPWAGIPNFWNVVSNLPFLAAGLFGLWRLPRLAANGGKPAYVAICAGIIGVSLGSAYYHFSPGNESLVWDRLPMTVAFMALFALLLEERVLPGRQFLTLASLLAVGMGSVLYWAWTESRGAGDLRFYGLVQFLPLILAPLILLWYPARFVQSRFLVWGLLFYVAAKAAEQADRQLYELTGAISGHSIKHLLAGLAALCIILAIPVRRPAGDS